MATQKSLLRQLWNSQENSYSESEHPVLQQAMDLIKSCYDKYMQLDIVVDKGCSHLRRLDIPLMTRKMNNLSGKVCGEKSLI